MNEELFQILITGAAGTAGVLLTKAYDAYKKEKNKSNKADALQKMYAILEEMYSKDLDLQRKVNTLAIENDNLKTLLNEIKNENATSN